MNSSNSFVATLPRRALSFHLFNPAMADYRDVSAIRAILFLAR
jgi:hypothetical protein